MLESAIQKKISTWLTTQGWCVKVINANKRGTPDLLACIDGRLVAVEVKRPGGRLSKIQEAQLQNIRDAGGIAIVATSVDDVVAKLSAIAEKPKEKSLVSG